MDLLSKGARSHLDNFLEPDPYYLVSQGQRESAWSKKYAHLTETIGHLIEDFSLVRFTPLNIKNHENISDILLTIDNIIQFGEDADVKTTDFDENNEEDENEPND